MPALARNPSVQKVEAEGSKAQIHPWLHGEFETSRGYMASSLKK